MMEARHDDDLRICGVVHDGIGKSTQYQVAILRFEAGKCGWRSMYPFHGHIDCPREFKSQTWGAIFVPALRHKNFSARFRPENQTHQRFSLKSSARTWSQGRLLAGFAW